MRPQGRVPSHKIREQVSQLPREGSFKLKADFKPQGDQPVAISELVDALTSGEREVTLLGVTGSGKTFAMANVVERLNRPTMVLAHNKTLAAQLYAEFRGFFPDNAIEYFVSYYDYYQPEAYVPSKDLFIDKDSSRNEQIEQLRLSATKSLIERNDVLVVATVSAIFGIGDPVDYHSMILHLRRGERLNRARIFKRLTDMQYRRDKYDFSRGTFRVRGDIIDVFPAENSELALRIEMFDDEIESLSMLDPLTGALVEKVPRFTVYPSSHYAMPVDTVKSSLKQIREELVEREEMLKGQDKIVEAQRLHQRTVYDLEMLMELGFCSGIENYSRHLSGREPGEPPPTLFDYLPGTGLLFVDESHVTVPQIGAMFKGDRSRKETLVEYGFRLPSALDNRPLKFEEFDALRPQTVYVSATPAEYERERSARIVEMVVRPTGLLDPKVEIRPAQTQVDDLLSEISERTKRKERILVTTLTKRMAEQLTEFIADHGHLVRYLHADVDTIERAEIIRDLRAGVFEVLVGINLLREGLDLPEVSLVAILDADKEGFLRSERSLVQTIGRSARHINGTAILYADTKTGSIERSIAETERRRKKQISYNKRNNITPEGITKAVEDLIESVSQMDIEAPRTKVHPSKMTPGELADQVSALEEAMHKAANELEFERAAELRDQVRVLKQVALGVEPAGQAPKYRKRGQHKAHKKKRRTSGTRP